jgi:protein gp37
MEALMIGTPNKPPKKRPTEAKKRIAALYAGSAIRAGKGAKWTHNLKWDLELMRAAFAKVKKGDVGFCGSMTDLFHPGCDPAMHAALAGFLRGLSKDRSVILLTKRPEGLLAFQKAYFPEGMPVNAWIGVTAGCQQAADARIPVLLQVQIQLGGVRLVSVEPMTGAVNLARYLPRVAGPWTQPPATWAEVQWPEWVPPAIRKQLDDFWGANAHRSPSEYESSIRTDCYVGIPNFGEKVMLRELASNGEKVSGRYIHICNNVGRIVCDDGSYKCVGLGLPTSKIITENHGDDGQIISTINWIIAGGESGDKARPMHPDWVRDLRDQCVAAGVDFHFKQWGEWRALTAEERPNSGDVWVCDRLLSTPHTQPWQPGDAGAEAGRWSKYADVLMRNVGKITTGRELDGRTWDERPDQECS